MLSTLDDDHLNYQHEFELSHLIFRRLHSTQHITAQISCLLWTGVFADVRHGSERDQIQDTSSRYECQVGVPPSRLQDSWMVSDQIAECLRYH